MLLVKLALRNISRSARDYGVYFVTLLFGVSVFYAFNSIGSQQILTEIMEGDSRSFIDLIDQMMSMFSVVVSFVLAFLILYANRFLIKRRKREFGTYLLLGMKPHQVSLIVLIETLCVGTLSFIAGIALGLILSQGLSYVTALLYGTILDEYRFVFSESALIKTLISFGIIFATVAIFNIGQVSRCKLITLFSAKNANEKFRLRSVPLSVVGFLVALGCIAFAYQELAENKLTHLDSNFTWATIFMVIGTLLLFWSVSGFVIAIISRTRGIYFRGLSMYTVRQIASRINTAFVSLWAITILLFFGITVFATGISLGNLLTSDMEKNTPYDATIINRLYALSSIEESDLPENASEEEQLKQAKINDIRNKYLPTVLEQWDSVEGDTARLLQNASPSWEKLVDKSAQIDCWDDPDNNFHELIEKTHVSFDMAIVPDVGISVVSESQVNKNLRLCGAPEISLPEGTYATDNTMELTKELRQELHNQQIPLTINGNTLKPSEIQLSRALSTQMLADEQCVIIVKDSVIEGYQERGIVLPKMSYINMNFKSGVDNTEELLSTLSQEANAAYYGSADDTFPYFDWPCGIVISKDAIQSSALGVRLLATYLAIYIGFVLLAASAALLAIQQLSQVEDSTPRMQTLSHLGCDAHMIYRSLLVQILVYFLAPLAVAACHSIVALKILNDSLLSAWGLSPGPTMAYTIGITTLVYGGYLLVTWLTSRGFVSAAIQKSR